MSVRLTGYGERPAIFVMCDGVLANQDDLLARRLDDGALLPTAMESLRLLALSGMPIFALAHCPSLSHDSHDMHGRKAVRAYADRLCAQLRARGMPVEAMLVVSGPAAEREYVRPAVARTLRRAARHYGIGLASSFLVCDTWAGVEAGLEAGCQPLLVMTGSGREEISRAQTMHVRAQTWYAADLMMAAMSIDAHVAARSAARRHVRALPATSSGIRPRTQTLT